MPINIKQCVQYIVDVCLHEQTSHPRVMWSNFGKLAVANNGSLSSPFQDSVKGLKASHGSSFTKKCTCLVIL